MWRAGWACGIFVDFWRADACGCNRSHPAISWCEHLFFGNMSMAIYLINSQSLQGVSKLVKWKISRCRMLMDVAMLLGHCCNPLHFPWIKRYVKMTSSTILQSLFNSPGKSFWDSNSDHQLSCSYKDPQKSIRVLCPAVRISQNIKSGGLQFIFCNAKWDATCVKSWKNYMSKQIFTLPRIFSGT